MHSLEAFVLSLAQSLPLEIFVIVASFLEEVIPPIPSPSVVVFAGTMAALQHYTVPMLVTLILAASLGKTVGAFTLYTFVKHTGDAVIDRFGGYFHVSKEDIRRYGNGITGTWRDYLLLSTLRGIPILPSVVLSVGSGILHVKKRVFLVGTMIGTIIRDSIYVTIGFTGVGVYREFAERTSTVETLLTLTVIGVLGIMLLIHIERRKKRNHT